MQETNDKIIENNYIFREIKEIKGKEQIIPENILILEDLAEIHEIKDLRPKTNVQHETISNKKIVSEVKLEGNINKPKNELNIEDQEEPILENENVSNLIEYIFEIIENGKNLNDCSKLKNSFNALEENEKNEVVEGVRIKIDNEEQENKFNELLKLLC